MKNILIITLTLLLSPVLVGAIDVNDFKINDVPSDYFYPEEFDKLVLDLTIPGPDILSELTIANDGTARDTADIVKLTLWKDADSEGFQGWEKDEELGTFEYDYDNIKWTISDLDLAIPQDGLRVFVSMETGRNPNNNRTLQMKVFGSDNVNPNIQTLKIFNSTDDLVPVSVIDSIETITTNSYTITGKARDQGGSTPAWVKIEINGTEYDVISIGDNYSTWKYEWKDMAEGTYTIKTTSEDWLENTETEGDEITVTVDFPDPEPDPEPTPDPEPEGGETPPLQTPREMIESMIAEIQTQIIELLNQLIQIYLQELGSI